MENSDGAMLAGTFYLICSLVVITSAFRRSRFSHLLIFFEYFYILGLGVFPVLASAGAIALPKSAISYNNATGNILNLSYLHLVSYSIGMLLGWASFRNQANKLGAYVAGIASRNAIDNTLVFYSVASFSVILMLAYFAISGFTSAITNAGAIRGGDFTSFAGLEQYQALKTASQIGIFAVIFVPYFIIKKPQSLAPVLLVLVSIACGFYLLSAARVVFFNTIILFIIFMFMYKRISIGIILLSVVGFSAIAFIMLFGKVAGVALGLLLEGNELDFGALPENFSTYFFQHFSHLLYSVDAGVRNFNSYGPVITADVLLSPLGFIPSFVFTGIGLDYLNYKYVPPASQLCFINTEYFDVDSPGSIPPYFVGVSAYIFPIVGGFIFGWVKFYSYSVVAHALSRLRSRPELLWLPLLLLLIGNNLILFIPTTIALATFLMTVLYCALSLRRHSKKLIPGAV